MDAQVPVSRWSCPPQARRLLQVLKEFGFADFFGRPQFPYGIVIGEGPDAVHITPAVARELIGRKKRGPSEKVVDKQGSIL